MEDRCSIENCSNKKGKGQKQKCTMHYRIETYGYCQDEFCRNPANSTDNYCQACRSRIKLNKTRLRHGDYFNNEIEKWCFRCKTVKPRVEFHNNGGSNDGIARACKLCVNETSKKYEKPYKRHSIKLEDFEKMISNQNNSCLICKRIFTEELKIVIDHDHNCCNSNRSCGRCIRGLLCSHCNKIEGFLRSLGSDACFKAIKFWAESVDNGFWVWYAKDSTQTKD